jgi:hypothetical protein
MAIGAGLAILGGTQLLGGILGSSAAKRRAAEQRRLQKQAMGVYQQFMNDPNYSPLRGESALLGGFSQAQRQIAGGGTAARQTLRTGAAQSSAAMQQSMAGRGLYGTTAFDNAQRGISSDLSRSLAGVDEAISQRLAGLSMQRGQSLAGFYSQATSQRQNQMENYINLLRDKPAAYSSGAYYGNMLGQLGGQAANLFGMYAMMGGGGGGGGGRPTLNGAELSGPLLPNGNYYSTGG